MRNNKNVPLISNYTYQFSWQNFFVIYVFHIVSKILRINFRQWQQQQISKQESFRLFQIFVKPWGEHLNGFMNSEYRVFCVPFYQNFANHGTKIGGIILKKTVKSEYNIMLYLYLWGHPVMCIGSQVLWCSFLWAITLPVFFAVSIITFARESWTLRYF